MPRETIWEEQCNRLRLTPRISKLLLVIHSTTKWDPCLEESWWHRYLTTIKTKPIELKTQREGQQRIMEMDKERKLWDHKLQLSPKTKEEVVKDMKDVLSWGLNSTRKERLNKTWKTSYKNSKSKLVKDYRWQIRRLEIRIERDWMSEEMKYWH